MRLRKELDAYLGIRPAKVFSGLIDQSPINEKKTQRNWYIGFKRND